MVIEGVYGVTSVLAFENVERVPVGSLVQFVQKVISIGNAAITESI